MFRRLYLVLTIFSFSLSVFANAKAPHKEWGLIVFLNGHNNLDSFGDGDIQEMLKAKDTSNIHVVVLHASLKYKKTRYRYIENGVAKTIKEVSPVDMGSYKNLVEFSKWAMNEFPADKYFIDIWNHGAGWQRNANEPEQFRNISSDDVFGTEITTEQLGVAMNEVSAHLGRKVDVVGMDACLMAMAEVAGEIQGSAKAMIASQDLEPGDGWPYDMFLQGFANLSDRSIESVASLLTKSFVDSYTNGSQGSNSKVTLSAVNLENFGRFENALRGLSNDLINSAVSDVGFIKRFIESQKYVQKFYQSDYVDFFDVVANLKNKNLLSSRAVADEVESAFKDLMIANNYGSYFSKAKGLSVWLPYFNYSTHGARYRELAFSKNTQWGDWLEKAYRTNNQ
jgi:hypothetical protein